MHGIAMARMEHPWYKHSTGTAHQPLPKQVCKCASVQVCKRAGVQACKCAVCKYASMRVCKRASVQVCECASVQVCKYASISLQVCKCASEQVCKFASVRVNARMPVCKSASMQVYKCASVRVSQYASMQDWQTANQAPPHSESLVPSAFHIPSPLWTAQRGPKGRFFQAFRGAGYTVRQDLGPRSRGPQR